MTNDKNEAAVLLGKLSAKSRFKGKTKKQISEEMRKVRLNMKFFKGKSIGRDPLRKIFSGIKQRCINLNNSGYSRYGGRGIKVVWNNFEEFENDMRESYNQHISVYGKTDTQIERIDNDGNYCKENCRWATRKEQSANKGSKNKDRNERSLTKA